MATDAITYHGLTRASALAVIWRNTHPDFRSSRGEPRSILTVRGIVALESMSDAEILDHAAYGIRHENHVGFSTRGLIVHPRVGRDWCGAIDHDGRAYVVNLMTGEQRLVSEHADKRTHEARLTAAFMASEAESDRLAKAA